MRPVAFIPMPFEVQLLRPDIVGTDELGNDVTRKQPPIAVPAAGWSEPSDQAKQTFDAPEHVTYALDLLAEAGRIKVGDSVRVDGVTCRAVGRANYDHGPFRFEPGIDVIKLGRSTG